MQISSPLMNEMFEFLSFKEALQTGFTPEIVVEEQANQGVQNLKGRISELTDKLKQRIDEVNQVRNRILAEASLVDMEKTVEYMKDLQKAVNLLKEEDAKLNAGLNRAQKILQNHSRTTSELQAVIDEMKKVLKNQKSTFPCQDRVYNFGENACRYAATNKKS